MTNSTAIIATVTPAVAKEWLAKNTRNRALNEPTVAKYRRDMLAGQWQFAADPIRFSNAGALLDGQHRLTALATCPDSTTISMLVVTGLPEETQLIMDQGKRRTPGDQLSLLGVKDSNVAAAGIRLYIAHETGMLFRDQSARNAERPTNAHMEAWYQLHTDLVDAVGSISRLKESDAPPSVAFCAALMFVNAYGVTWTQEFFRLLAVGAGEGHPINALDKRLQRVRRERLGLAPRDYLALFIQAATTWRQGRTISKFIRPAGARWTRDTFPTLATEEAAA